jgi:hypothetical protein
VIPYVTQLLLRLATGLRSGGELSICHLVNELRALECSISNTTHRLLLLIAIALKTPVAKFNQGN